MRHFLVALGLTCCMVGSGAAQTPPSQLPGAAPGKVEAPTEALPTQGTASSVTPVPGHVDVHFARGSAKIADAEHGAVARLANLCRAGDSGKVMLVGYPDDSGDPRQAIALALRRAEVVMNAVLARGVHHNLAWEVSAETAPDQHNGKFGTVVGRCG